MVPDSIGTLIAFLGLVAPGVVFETLRRRRRPATSDSAFQEASRTALTSFVFTTLATIAVLLLGRVAPEAVADVSRWVSVGGPYFASDPLLATWTVLLEVAVACAFAWAADVILARGTEPTVTQAGQWFVVFRRGVPKGVRPWLHLRLVDGTEFFGFLDHYTNSDDPAERELALRGPRLQMRANGATETKQLERWDRVLVSGSQITWMSVAYVNDTTGELLAADVRT